MKHRLFVVIIMSLMLHACSGDRSAPPAELLYTCPMPADSVFSNEPGSCPKCGMDLVPIHEDPLKLIPETLLKSANQEVVAHLPTVKLVQQEEAIEIDAYGFVAYDTREAGVISANFSGRIERLFVNYRYQKIQKGQKIMEVYSPELLTAQENLIYLLKNDPDNATMIRAAKQKLRLLGMSVSQLEQVVKTGTSLQTITIFSNYSGHIHESTSDGEMVQEAGQMKDIAATTSELNLKEGMYINKGQKLFEVYNPNKAWVILNVFGAQAAMVKVGHKVRINPEAAPDKDFRASINFIEPFYRNESKTPTARVYFNNQESAIPVGSQVKATIFAGNSNGHWLPRQAVLALGRRNVVFVHKGNFFETKEVKTGMSNRNLIQIESGLNLTDSVAANAQYLVDSESFIGIAK